MSLRRRDHGLTFDVFVNSTKTFQLIIENPDGTVRDLSNTTTFADGRVKIVKPDTTVIATYAISYIDRLNGIVEFISLAADNTVANSGNWTGDLELDNDTAQVIDQQVFNFNIIESY